MTHVPEIWKPIPGFPGYDASNLGQVRSYHAHVGQGWAQKSQPQRILRTSLSGDYRTVRLMRDGKRNTRLVGVLVLSAFIGPRPFNMEACHGDGNPQNDVLDNLRWDTHSANLQDARNQGRQPGRPDKLTDSDVILLRTLAAEGHDDQSLAMRFGISVNYARRLRCGYYRSVGGPITKYRFIRMHGLEVQHVGS